MGWKTYGVVIVPVVGFEAVGAAAAEGTGYEQGHNRRPDIWVGQMDEVQKLSLLTICSKQKGPKQARQ